MHVIGTSISFMGIQISHHLSIAISTQKDGWVHMCVAFQQNVNIGCNYNFEPFRNVSLKFNFNALQVGDWLNYRTLAFYYCDSIMQHKMQMIA